jgi:hypothetical protein
MLVACRLAGLSALDTHYAGINASTQTLGPHLAKLAGGPGRPHGPNIHELTMLEVHWKIGASKRRTPVHR